MLNSEKAPENRKLSGEEMTKIAVFENREENLHYEGVIDIDPKELAKNLDQVVLVDVRQPEEFIGELGHIPNAKLIALDTIPENFSQIPKDKTVIFVCRSGGRSARATALALQNGYTHVYNLKGGMLLWNDLHLPTEM
jgi:rhodanese-related sulfurtransferase